MFEKRKCDGNAAVNKVIMFQKRKCDGNAAVNKVITNLKFLDEETGEINP